MKPLGRKQIKTMKEMIEWGQGYWLYDWKLYSDEKAVLETLLRRGLVARVESTPWGRMQSYVVTRDGKEALMIRGAIEREARQ